MSLINHMRRHSDVVFMLLSKQDLQRSLLFLFSVVYFGTLATARHYGEVQSINLWRDELTMFCPIANVIADQLGNTFASIHAPDI